MAEKSAQPEQIEAEAFDWMQCFASGKGRASDLAALKLWCARSPAHREAFERVSRTWRDLGAVAAPFPSKLVIAKSPARMSRRVLLGGAVAASAAGAVAMLHPPLELWPSLSEFSADYHTRPGEQRQVKLANGASIELNSRTFLALRPAVGQAGVELISGEAMISVPSIANMPLTVLAGDGRIVAKYARFNVRNDRGSVCVTCIEGAVRIERHQSVLALAAGDQIAYSDQAISPVVTADPAAVTAWQKGLVIFRSTPIVEVIAEINRYRPGRVILINAALGRRQLNARFRIEDMDKVVGQIEQIFGAHATTLPYGVLLLS
ncbi:MAG: FecR domain-containing protein [Pseudomonadota bacterium]